MLDLFALDADVGDPMLAAAIRAAGNVQLDLLVETGQALIELSSEPPSEAFGFGEGELAKLGTGASYCTSRECRNLDRQAYRRQFCCDGPGVFLADVCQHNVLLRREAKV